MVGEKPEALGTLGDVRAGVGQRVEDQALGGEHAREKQQDPHGESSDTREMCVHSFSDFPELG